MTPALLLLLAACATEPAPLQVGAAAAEIRGEDSMIIAGGIHPGRVRGQEGELRASAIVVGRDDTRLAIVALDVLMVSRDLLDAAARRIEKETGIPFANILINCTHTHHAPSTVDVHAYGRDPEFCRRMVDATVRAVRDANDALDDAVAYYALGHESSVGMNSRLLLSDGTIFWVGDRSDAVQPTGPFDPQVPVLAFRDRHHEVAALLFNHSTHTIGTGKPGVRSPSFYGLAAQDLEKEHGGTTVFLQGASGSTHHLGRVPFPEMVRRMKGAVNEAIARAEPTPFPKLGAIRREFTFHVRTFDDAAEEAAVSAYCRKRTGRGAEPIIEAFRHARKTLAPVQGERRVTWIQGLRIGDVAIVGVPAEFFTLLGMEIKRRSPFRHTIIAELANDWIGYLPDREAHARGGYQVWTGFHSYAEIGTGEAMVNEVVNLLDDLKRPPPP